MLAVCQQIQAEHLGKLVSTASASSAGKDRYNQIVRSVHRNNTECLSF